LQKIILFLIFALSNMKVLSEEPKNDTTIQYPTFWTAEWLDVAIKELDTRAMSPEKRLAYEMTLAANAQAIQAEKEKVAAAEAIGEARGVAIGEAIGEAGGVAIGEARGVAIGEARAMEQAQAEKAAQQYALKKTIIRGLLAEGFTDEKILTLIGETPEFLQKVKIEIENEA
jgi:hypothetical protein